MGSPFQRAFSGKSPLNKHGKIQKKIEKARRKDGDNPDFYETYSHLYDAKAKAEAAHSNKQDVRIVEEERDSSRTDAAMSRKASPLNKKNPHPVDTAAHAAFEKRQARELKESTKTIELSKTPEGRKQLASRKKR